MPKKTTKTRLRRITLTGFRGARKPISLDCGPKHSSLVLFGDNGDGKSTFTDAIEWFFTDRIDYLQREGCGREAYFNRYMPLKQDATVELSFSDETLDATKTLHRKARSSLTCSTPDGVEYVSRSGGESLILRHHTMRRFVEMSKKQKLEAVEEVIGFAIVVQAREALLQALNALRRDSEFPRLQGQRTEKERDLAATLGLPEFGDADVLKHAEKLVAQSGLPDSITNDAEFSNAVETLEARSVATERGKELSSLNDAAQKATLLRDGACLLRRVRALVSGHNKLAADQERVKAVALEKLYRAAIEAIAADLVERGQCPICRAPVDTDELLASLQEEVACIASLVTRREKIVRAAGTLATRLGSVRRGLDDLLASPAKDEFLSDDATSNIGELSGAMSTCTDTLQRIEASYDAVGVPSHPEALDGIAVTEAAVKARIAQRTEKLQETDEEKAFYERVHVLRGLLEDHLRHEELRRLVAAYESQIEPLQKVHDKFEDMERTAVAKVLATISTDVNDYMTFLHPDDEFDQVELVTTERRGIEFKLKYHGQEVSPPTKILSEAHLNSLGICMFIASARHFNRTNGFVILDDVVTSFDRGHRRQLARLLDEKLPHTQILLLTHDDLWFDMLKSELRPNAWLFRELTKWKKETGVDVRDSPLTLKERIRDYLASNDISGAANKCRTLIEDILKQRCQDLGVRALEFRTGRANDQRTARELIDALTSYLKGNQSLRGKASKASFDHLRATQLITNFGSHHATLGATGLARGDIETALQDIEEFESLFVCPDCRTRASIKFSALNSKVKQCQCGNLRI